MAKTFFIIIFGIMYNTPFAFLSYQAWIHNNKVLAGLMLLVCVLIMTGYIKAIKTEFYESPNS
jgi:hypothetical protein